MASAACQACTGENATLHTQRAPITHLPSTLPISQPIPQNINTPYTLQPDTSSWGTKIKLEPSKPVLGLATPPLASGVQGRQGAVAVVVLHGDGSLRGFAPSGPDSLACVFTLQGS